MKNQGLSLIELTIAVGLATFLMLTATKFVGTSDKQIKIDQENIEQFILKAGSDLIIQQDLLGARPSLNNVFLPENKRFFYYDPYKNCEQTNGPKECAISNYELKFPAGKKESPIFYLLTSSKGTIRFEITPHRAFNSAKTYKGLNYPHDPAKFKDLTASTTNPTPWIKDFAVLLYSSIEYKDPKIENILTPMIFLGSPSNDGKCKTSMFAGQTTMLAPIKDPLGIIRDYHPNFTEAQKYLSAAKIKTEKDFLENIFIKEAIPFSLFLENVELISYQLIKDNIKDPHGRLVRSKALLVCKGGQFTFSFKEKDKVNSFAILDKVEAVTFFREGLNSPIISYEIKEFKRK